MKIKMWGSIILAVAIVIALLSVYASGILTNNTVNDVSSDNTGPSTAQSPGNDGQGTSGVTTWSTSANDIYGPTTIDGFYTQLSSNALEGTTIGQNGGMVLAGKDLWTNSTFYFDVSSSVTDYGMQWYNGGSTFSNGGYLSVNTSIAYMVEIYNNNGINVSDVRIGSVSGPSGAILGNTSLPTTDMHLRSLEQVDPDTVIAVLTFQPYDLISLVDGHFGGLGPFNSSQSAVPSDNMKEMAAYAPVSVGFISPGNYDLSFFLVDLNGTDYQDSTISVPSSNGEIVSPVTTVPLNVGAEPDWTALMALSANSDELNAIGSRLPNDTLNSTINATVSYQYTPGTLKNDTNYSMTVVEKAVGSGYSGEVWDVLSLGYGDASNFTLFMQASNGTWEKVTPVSVFGYEYYVLGPWNTSEGEHTINLRFSYTGQSVEYRGDLITLTTGCAVAGDQLFYHDDKEGTLFTVNASA